MRKIKHTATSWTIEKPEPGDPNLENHKKGIITIRQGTLEDYSTTCTIYPCFSGFKLSMRHAKLIASAPDLLALLTSYFEMMGKSETEQHFDHLLQESRWNERAKAIIKKATT